MGTYTTNYQLYMPTIGEQGWGELINGNYQTIDTTMKSLSNRITAVENEVNGALSCTSVTTSGTITSTGKITANGGIGTTTLTASSTSTFTGKITANGGIGTKALTTTSISNSGNMTNTGTLTSTGMVYANGGITTPSISGVTLINSVYRIIPNQTSGYPYCTYNGNSSTTSKDSYANLASFCIPISTNFELSETTFTANYSMSSFNNNIKAWRLLEDGTAILSGSTAKSGTFNAEAGKTYTLQGMSTASNSTVSGSMSVYVYV